MSVCDNNWDYVIDFDKIEKKSNDEFNAKIIEWQESIAKKLEKAFNNQKLNSGKAIEHQEDELKDLIKKNQELKLQIDKELQEITHSQAQYETYKKDQELLTTEIKDTHESYLMAKKIYKKYLNIYYTIESREADKQTIYVQFFTESKKESEKYSVRLLRRANGGSVKYEIISTNPTIDTLPEIQKKLKESEDVPGAICAIRETFLYMKTHKK